MAPPDMTKTIFPIQPVPPVKNKKGIPGKGYAFKRCCVLSPCAGITQIRFKEYYLSPGLFCPQAPLNLQVIILFQTPVIIKKNLQLLFI